ncbi:MAG: HWE histidine kinase domain-containing protein, partial [Phenylobacterium sp.]
MTRSRGKVRTPPRGGVDHVFLGDGGEMGGLIRAYDWAASPIGAPETWPQSLKTAVRLMLTSRHPMFIWWGPELIQFYNDAYRQTMGPERHPSALGDRGRDCWAEIWPVIGPQIELVMAGRGSTWHEDQLVPVTRHGGLQQVWWTYSYSPIDVEGGVGGVLVVCNDVTREHLTREALARSNQQLMGDVDRLRELFAQAPGFIAVVSGPQHVFEFVNAAYERLAGRSDLLGRPIRERLPEVEAQGFIALLDRVYASGEAYVGHGAPLTVDRGPGQAAELHYLDFVYQPIRDAAGVVTGIFVEGYDVTDRVQAEARQALLVDEMNHRVKNTLATVQSLAMLTGKSASTVAEFKSSLSGRIQAMAKTQDLLIRGHSEPLAVREVLEAELAPYLGVGQQVQVHCEAMTIAPRAAVSLGLLVHELLTNAAKYGALSDPDGSLVVRCERRAGGAVLVWHEEAQHRAPSD